MSVILYSSKCPKCLILEKKLKDSGIEYQEVNDIDVMLDKGFVSAPMLEVNDNVMDYSKAIKWIMEGKTNEE